MTIGNKWVQYLVALSLSLPALVHASPVLPDNHRPLSVSAAAADRIGQLVATPNMQPTWTQVTWIQEFGQWSGLKAGPVASLEGAPSLAGLLDEIKKA